MANQAGESPTDAGSSGNQPSRRANRRKASYLLTETDAFLLGRLPEPYAEILRQDGSMEEIAQRLHIALGTVKSRTHRARAALDRLRAEAKSEPQQ